jgi:MFS family permease
MTDSAALSYEIRSTARPLWPAFVAESLSSIGTTLLSVGIFFYTEHYFGWGLKQNFLLAAGQGAAYVIGSLNAHRVATMFGRRRGLIRIFATLTLLALLPLLNNVPAWTVAVLLAYTLIVALSWPALESLVSSDADARDMSKHVGMYNLVWSGTNAVTFAASGAIIAYWPGGIFIVPAIAHGVSAVVMVLNPSIEPQIPPDRVAHAAPEPELFAKRKRAMWLARISLPATYVVVYGLSAMMPLLPVMQPLETSARTAVGSVWMVARFFAFLFLGMTAWWHTRPRILLVAAIGMLAAFLGVTMSESLPTMIAWQVVLGVVMGVIYASSLYFGMVLSEGSTEHGGYHEALIGLGSVVGPGTAAVTQFVWPGDLRAGVVAVGCMIGLSVIAAGIASVAAPRRPTG